MNKAGLFVSGELYEREITLADGTKEIMHFRQLPWRDIRRFQIAERSEDDDVRVDAAARLVVPSLCDPDGKPAITYDEAAYIVPEVMEQLVMAVLSAGKRERKPDEIEGDSAGEGDPGNG